MKRIATVLALLIMACGSLAACGGAAAPETPAPADGQQQENPSLPT